MLEMEARRCYVDRCLNSIYHPERWVGAEEGCEYHQSSCQPRWARRTWRGRGSWRGWRSSRRVACSPSCRIVLSGIGIIISGIKQFDNFAKKSVICSSVGGPDVEEAEYRNCSQSFLRGLVLNSFIEEIEKGTDPQLLLSQKNILWWCHLFVCFSDNFVVTVSFGKLRQSMAAQYVKSWSRHLPTPPPPPLYYNTLASVSTEVEEEE